MEKLIGSFDTRRGHEQVRVYVVEDNGKTHISVQMFSYRKGDWCLTKKGVTIVGAKVYKLVKLIEKAAEFIAINRFQDTVVA